MQIFASMSERMGLIDVADYAQRFEAMGSAGAIGRPFRTRPRNSGARESGGTLFDALVPHGTHADIGTALQSDYGSLVDRMTFPSPEDPLLDAQSADVIATLDRV